MGPELDYEMWLLKLINGDDTESFFEFPHKNRTRLMFQVSMIINIG